jgi:dihydrofolate reductase
MAINRPPIAMIAAMDRNRVIGAEGGLPWHLPADMQHFVRTTRGKPVIMGRRNYEDIGGALPKRHNVVLTRDRGYQAAGCTIATRPEEAIEAAGTADEIMVIGGEEIYRLFLAESQRLYLTYVDTSIRGDTYFPPLAAGDWRETRREHRPPDDQNQYAMAFVTLERTPPLA